MAFGSLSTYSLISIAIQIALIVHVIRTGRSWLWVVVLALLPGIGTLAYVVIELIPPLFRGPAARRTARGMKRALDPGAELRRLESEVRVMGDVASRQRYADELARHGRYDEAIAKYREALTGLYAEDPNLMLGLARAQFEKGDATAARETLDEIIRLNPDFRSPEGHLLYARALEAEGNAAKALAEYEVLAPAYPGAEASVRYAQLLKAQGRGADAARIVRELLEQARIAPAHYRRAQRTWLDSARRLAAALPSDR